MLSMQEATQIVARLWSMRSARDARLRELQKFICPYRGILDRRTTDITPPHQFLRFTRAASSAALRAASGMTVGMTPGNAPWFRPDFTERDLLELDGARDWLDRIDSLLKDTLAAGGFYQAIQNFNLDLIWAGSAMLFAEASDLSTLRYECLQQGTWAVALNSEGHVDTVVRTCKMSARDLERIFGTAAMSDRAREYLKRNRQDVITVLHLAIREAPDGTPTSVASYWWEEGCHSFLRTSGYYEMPFFFTAWHEGVTPYGTGPGDEALADARQMDLLERHKLEGLAKIINPPTMAPPSLKGHVDLGAGSINFTPERQQISPILDLAHFATSLPHLREEIKTVGTRLEDALMASIFTSMPLAQRPAGMSATEFLERKREALQQLGPVISAYEPNVLTPLLFRTLQSLDRACLLPLPPQSMSGVDLSVKISFISPMANALRQTAAEASRAIFQDVAQMAQVTGNPSVLDKVDLDQLVDELANALGSPGSIIRSDAEVARIRQQREQAQMQQALAQMAMQQPMPEEPTEEM